jgi:type I restriction enzyme S subunit
MRERPLPPGWVWTTISEIVDHDGVFSDGDWVESKDQDPNGDVRLIQLADVGDGVYRDRSNRFLTKEKADELKCTYLKPGDVLIARMPDPLGRACIFPGDLKTSVTVVDVCVVRTGSSGINHRWLMHTVNSPAFRQGIASLQSGSTRKRISRRNLARVELPLPPLPEQQRIVAEIEKQMTRLDAGVAALKRAQARLRRYKAAVLKAACEGRLVPQDPADEPADVLLRRLLAERRCRWEAEQRAKGKDPRKLKYKEPAPPDTDDLPGLPREWIYTNLAPLLSYTRTGMRTGPFGSLLKKHEHQLTGVPVLGIENIDKMKFVRGSKIHITEEKAEQLSNYAVYPGDVLISRSGTVGEVCAVPEGIGEARISTNLMRVAFAPKGILPFFFCLLFNGSPFVCDQVSDLCSGSTRDFINQKILSSIIFPLPPLPEQQRIVAEVERRLSVVEGMEAALETNLKRAKRLRQAILKQAFEGRLAPQDPSDEPASALLGRIQEAKVKAEGKGQRQKGKQLRLPNV